MGRSDGEGYGHNIIHYNEGGHDRDFFNRLEFEVPCDSDLPFENFLVCEEQIPVRPKCTNVHIVHVDDQCNTDRRRFLCGSGFFTQFGP